MCTTTNPRDINVLLGLSTYQGMTDEEIELIIEYKAEQIVIRDNIAIERAQSQQRIDALIAQAASNSQQTHDMLESILNRNVNITPLVQPSTVTPQSIEV